jgi:hypothetical protein
MKREVNNVKINTKAFEEAAKKRKKFRKKVASLFLVTTLVTGGCSFKEPLINMFKPSEVIENPVETIDTIHYEELDIMIKPEGIVIIEGKEYDLAELKEKYGLAYIFLVEMSEEEIDQKFKSLVEMWKNIETHNKENPERYMSVDNLGLAHEYPNYETYIKMIKLRDFEQTPGLKMIMESKASLPNADYISYLFPRIGCFLEETLDMDGKLEEMCLIIRDESNIYPIIAGLLPIDSISYLEREHYVKMNQFIYENTVKAVEKMGYSIEDFRLDSKAITK